MNENVKVVFGLIGGLALFLYGMNSMSDALQKAAGEKMKRILALLGALFFIILYAFTLIVAIFDFPYKVAVLQLSLIHI